MKYISINYEKISQTEKSVEYFRLALNLEEKYNIKTLEKDIEQL